MNIYIFDFGNQIKIGQSGNVKQRLRHIETQSGREAVQHFSIKADSKYENLMHKVLSEYRGVGEYFTFPFDFAVSILKSLVRFEFTKEVKEGSQLFLPLSMPDFSPKRNNGLDAKEIGERIGIKPRAAKKRLERAGIKPIGYSGPTAIYSEDVVEKIRNVRGPGRPAKKPEAPAKPRKAKKS